MLFRSLADLLEHVRRGFAEYDAGQIDAFELDDLIHHYKRVTQKLWSFATGSGGQIETAAQTLVWALLGGVRLLVGEGESFAELDLCERGAQRVRVEVFEAGSERRSRSMRATSAGAGCTTPPPSSWLVVTGRWRSKRASARAPWGTTASTWRRW